MKPKWLTKELAIVVVVMLLAGGSPILAQEADTKPDWREDYAYTLGTQAYSPW